MAIADPLQQMPDRSLRSRVRSLTCAAVLTAAACGGCQNGTTNTTEMADPLGQYAMPAYTTCSPLHDPHKMLFNGGGVLRNDSPATTYTVTGVTLQNTSNLVQMNSYLVPDVNGGGRLNSVVDDLTPKLARRIALKGEKWAWERRVPAEGATLAPGQSAEVVVAFKEQQPGPWSFSGIRTEYTDGASQFAHNAPASGTTDMSRCSG